MPSMTKVWFESETLRRLITNERIVGIKDSSGDMDYFQTVIDLKKQREDWSVLIGPETKMIEVVRGGADGGVNGGANLYPRLFASAYQAALDNDDTLCDSLQEKIVALGQIYDVGKYASRHIKATKCAAGLLGLCDDFLAEPFNRFYEEDRKRVKEILDSRDWES